MGCKLGIEQILNNKNNYLDTIGPSATSKNQITFQIPGRGDQGVHPLNQRLSDQGLHACSGECAGFSCGGGGGKKT